MVTRHAGGLMRQVAPSVMRGCTQVSAWHLTIPLNESPVFIDVLTL